MTMHAETPADTPPSTSPPGPAGKVEEKEGGEGREEEVGLWGKLVLTAFPFFLVFLFLLLEWWIRGQS